mmetsp:Transcript_3153/g.9131  ORF Transcript_3153/g.9131 Transcript_3153/m.9131 type:complete len:201 (-) Transcript_3153:7-609(-)
MTWPAFSSSQLARTMDGRVATWSAGAPSSGGTVTSCAVGQKGRTLRSSGCRTRHSGGADVDSARNLPYLITSSGLMVLRGRCSARSARSAAAVRLSSRSSSSATRALTLSCLAARASRRRASLVASRWCSSSASAVARRDLSASVSALAAECAAVAADLRIGALARKPSSLSSSAWKPARLPSTRVSMAEAFIVGNTHVG